MCSRIKRKEPLNQVTHSVRAAQTILQYGVGAMVDFPDQTLITAAPETWSQTVRIDDDRFAQSLGVDYFAMPTKISYSRFPEWYFCPKCRKFQPLKKWFDEYNNADNQKILDSDPNMIKHIQCTTCRQDLVVARIVTVCEKGHINDFPWIEWVHVQNKKPICQNPELKFKTGASSSEGLEGLGISCSCDAFATLKGAFDVDCFKKLDENTKEKIFICGGRHPQKNKKDDCDRYPRTAQRGSSSVYFPVVYSSLVIPPYADKINIKIEKSSQFMSSEITLAEMDDERTRILEKKFLDWTQKIANEIGEPEASVKTILQRKWYPENNLNFEPTSIQYKIEEYEALTGKLEGSQDSKGDFSRKGVKKELFEESLPFIKAVSLIDKIRVVNALIGFSRINPVFRKEDNGFVPIKDFRTRWYPAYQVRGEGIFIEFDTSKIDRWIHDNPAVVERTNKISAHYDKSFIGTNHPRSITPRFVLLHTISHLLIKQLSFESGYSIASLSERIYCADDNEAKQMAGIFIYTASGDSEGTLGGLVRQGEPDMFPKIFKKAVINAKTCSHDPICISSEGQGRDSLNLAACHACALLPETSCEERNSFLDRGMVVGTFDNKNIGFFNRFLFAQEAVE